MASEELDDLLRVRRHRLKESPRWDEQEATRAKCFPSFRRASSAAATAAQRRFRRAIGFRTTAAPIPKRTMFAVAGSA